MMNSLVGDLRYGFIDKNTVADKKYNPRLIRNDESATMYNALREELRTATSFIFSVAFISPAALAMLKEDLLQFSGPMTIITSNYLDFNSPSMFRELLEIEGLNVYIYPEDHHRGFHPKGYLFYKEVELSAIVGSANLTQKALQENEEWNLHFSSHQNGDITFQIETAIDMQRSRCIPLTHQWVDEYEQNRVPPVSKNTHTKLLPEGPVIANQMQQVALSNIADLRQSGERKGLIISATGTGKTILAALAVKEAQAKRVLFVAHREQILEKTKSEFQKVLAYSGSELTDADFGLLVGGKRETDARYLFASVQSLYSQSTYKTFSPDAFDFIIIDEVHRGAANSYKPVFAYFNSEFVLGLTATPERPDSGDIFRLFDFNVPYEIRLQAALEADMLAPFHYFGVTDFDDGVRAIGDKTASIDALVAEDRIDYLLEKLRVYGFPERVKGLIFCSRKDEAKALSEQLNQKQLFGRQLRTKVLLGEDSISTRNAVVAELSAGELDYIITVDIFNEGIDIPAVNQVVMLRGTESNIIFTQQLGRGLRKAPGKDHLRVIDFIGNYKNNYMIPMALFGDSSINKSKLKSKVVDPSNIPSGSTVSFDEIAKEKILKAIDTASVDTIAEFKKDIQLLQYRLNRVPRLMDFARFNLVDPTVISTRRTKNYWELLHQVDKAATGPTDKQSEYLKFLSRELLPGKQPQELLLLDQLIKHGSITREEFSDLLDTRAVSHSELDLSVVERVLNLDFYPKRAYEEIRLVRYDDETSRYSLTEEFLALYNKWDSSYPNSFREHVDDIIQTGLFLSRENDYFAGVLRRNQRYSRKDVSRLLRLRSNQSGTLNGYKIDSHSQTIPIFVNYRKHKGLAPRIAYEDEFIDHSTMRWFTRSNRTLKSQEVQSIIQHKFPIHLFVRRDDLPDEGFTYLGEATPSDPQQAKMKGVKGKDSNVVTMKLHLEHPVPDTFFEYLHAKPID
ncbi:helicase [Corynebacterium sp. LK29]|uniref:DUF3427 domain-containing protein n=1 Tax=Corynebacterium sp. LK29 TaxID=2044578 RepID=UPI0016524DF9|nr:DEAD/DEAH box helicase [Corynebacterium sp. LK29]MBC6831870.1 helicase [Corynebacterium sp. LK29]